MPPTIRRGRRRSPQCPYLARMSSPGFPGFDLSRQSQSHAVLDGRNARAHRLAVELHEAIETDTHRTVTSAGFAVRAGSAKYPPAARIECGSNGLPAIGLERVAVHGQRDRLAESDVACLNITAHLVWPSRNVPNSHSAPSRAMTSA